MVFFGAAEDSLNRFFPLVIQSFHPECVSDIFSDFHIGFPYVASYYFYTVFAFCTLTKIWTWFAVFAVAFVFPISITVCRGVAQDLVRRADIAVIVLIINILILPEESILCHWSFVREQRSDPIIQKKFSNRRRFVACVQDASGYLKKDLSFNWQLNTQKSWIYLCRKFRALILETKNPQMKIYRNTMNYPEILRKTD